MRLRIPRLLVHSSRRRALLGSRLRRGSETNCRGPRAAADSKLGGVAAPGWRSLQAAPLRRISGGLCRGARLFGCAVGPWRLGTSPEACCVQAVAARRHSAVRASWRGTERGQLQVTGSDMRAQRPSISWCPVAGPPHHTTSHQTMTATVMYWPVSPRPPSPIINLTTLIPSI